MLAYIIQRIWIAALNDEQLRQAQTELRRTGEYLEY